MTRRRRADSGNDCYGDGCFYPHCESCWGFAYHRWAPNQNPELGCVPYVDSDCALCRAHPPPRPPGGRFANLRNLLDTNVAETHRQQGNEHPPHLLLATNFWDWSSGAPRRRRLPEPDSEPEQESASESETESAEESERSPDPEPAAPPDRQPARQPEQRQPAQQPNTAGIAEVRIDVMVNALDERVLRRALIAAARFDPETHRDLVRHYNAQLRRAAEQ